jgi:hypothetical protein
VNVIGDLAMDIGSHLELDLAGTSPGEFDTIVVDGNVNFELGAHLELAMLDPNDPQNGTNLFLPEPGNYFDVLTADSINAELLLIEAPEFDNRAFVAGVVDVGVGAGQALRITVVPVGLPGDYNHDDVVDAADYVLWRKYNSTSTNLPNDDTPGVDQSDYTRWRAHFGETTGLGSTGSASVIPEPSPAVIFTLGSVLLWCRRRAKLPLSHLG